MATDYEQFYRENRHGLGEPTKEFVDFFEKYNGERSKVLDIGCGQGRDALFIGRLGHSVTAIDQSPSGIDDLRLDASAEGLAIDAEVADVRDYTPHGIFDVIVIDRTLHMLDPRERTKVLRDLVRATTQGSHILIADEQSNIPAFKMVFDKTKGEWTSTLERRGYLFVQRG